MNYIEFAKKKLQKQIEKNKEKGIINKQNLIAVAFNGKKVVGIGFNSFTKSHPTQYRSAKSINCHIYDSGKDCKYPHAEIMAIDNAIKNKKHIDHLVVVRLKFDGTLGLAKPCNICMSKIKSLKIKYLTYSMDE